MNSPSAHLIQRCSPTPFVAGWLWIYSLAVDNAMTIRELMRLLAAGDTNAAGTVIDTSIDVARLARLTDTDYGLAKLSFAELFGFGANQTTEIFHCPGCLMQLYESSLNALRIMERCPIHDEPYIRCKACARSFSLSRNDIIPRYLNCCTTGISIDLLDHRHRIQPDFENEMSSINRSLVEWLVRLHGAHSHHGLLSALFSNKSNARRPDPIFPWILGAATAIEPSPPRILFPSQPSLCRIIERSLSDINDAFDDRMIYRIVRRWITHTYSRRHRQCLAELLRLAQHEREAIEISNCCPFALALLSWRAAREGCTIDALNMKAPPSDISLPYWIKKDTPAQAKLISLMIDFIRLWKLTLDHISATLPFKIQTNHSETRVMAKYINDQNAIIGLLPVTEVIRDRTTNICVTRSTSARPSVNSNESYNRHGWNHVADGVTSFTVSNFSEKYRASYDYILA